MKNTNAKENVKQKRKHAKAPLHAIGAETSQICISNAYVTPNLGEPSPRGTTNSAASQPSKRWIAARLVSYGQAASRQLAYVRSYIAGWWSPDFCRKMPDARTLSSNRSGTAVSCRQMARRQILPLNRIHVRTEKRQRIIKEDKVSRSVLCLKTLAWNELKECFAVRYLSAD